MPAKKLYTVSEQLNQTVIFSLDKEIYSYIPSGQFQIQSQIKTYVDNYKLTIPDAKNFKFIIQYPSGSRTDENGRNVELLPARLICQFTVTEENGKLSQEIVISENTLQARLALNTFYAYNIGEKKVTGEGASSTIKQYQEEKGRLDSARRKKGWLLLLLGIAILVAGMIPLFLGILTPVMIIPLVLGPFLCAIPALASAHFLLRSSEEVYRNAYFDLPSFISSFVGEPIYLPETTINPKSLGSESIMSPQSEANQVGVKEKLADTQSTGSNVKPGSKT